MGSLLQHKNLDKACALWYNPCIWYKNGDDEMTKLLLRLFVKNYRQTDDPSVRLVIGKLAGTVGIICNLLLFAGKISVGLLTGAVSIIADAVNNLSDASSSLITLLGFRLAQRPADRNHPYGHARYEYLSGLAVAAFIFLVGGELVASSVEKIFQPVFVEFSAATFVILLAAIAIKLWMFLFYRCLGNQIQSATLLAAAADSRNDVIATAAVLAGCLVSKFTAFSIDGFVGLAVALFILYSGVQIAKETVSPLIGKRADQELVQRISDIILSHDKILGIHDLLLHDYGPGQCFASVHAEMSAEEDPLVCHDIIDDIECDLLEKLNVHLVIHYDPVVTNDPEWDSLRQTVHMIVEAIDPVLSVHDFRLVKGAEQTKLVFDLAVPYGTKHSGRELKRQIDEKLTERGIGYPTVIRVEKAEE